MHVWVCLFLSLSPVRMKSQLFQIHTSCLTVIDIEYSSYTVPMMTLLRLQEEEKTKQKKVFFSVNHPTPTYLASIQTVVDNHICVISLTVLPERLRYPSSFFTRGDVLYRPKENLAVVLLVLPLTFIGM